MILLKNLDAAGKMADEDFEAGRSTSFEALRLSRVLIALNIPPRNGFARESTQPRRTF
jgi:hypothetical protein